jgi:hypothetical protein
MMALEPLDIKAPFMLEFSSVGLLELLYEKYALGLLETAALLQRSTGFEFH